MPWSGTPTRADKWCWGLFLAMGLYGLAMLPLRPVILGLSTYGLAYVTGDSLAMIDIGASMRDSNQPWWWLALLVAAIQVAKFDLIFFWAGRLWGHRLIEMTTGRSARARRTVARGIRWAEKWSLPAVFVAWFLPGVPTQVIIVVAGAARERWRWFLLADLLGALANRALFMYAGYRVGEPAKEFIDVIQRWSLWISIALLVLVVVVQFRRAKDSDRAG